MRLHGSKDSCLKGELADPQESLVLCWYTDADHCSSQEDTKSSSGMFLCLERPNSFLPLSCAFVVGKPQTDGHG